MHTESGIFWLASSDAEIARARTILRDLTQPGVLDELGFLVMLGALSDRLYPAMNTIMTRARYLIFVPAIFRHVEERLAKKGGNSARLIKDLQFELCKALCDTDENANGIIGKQSGRDIIRPPSNVYWNALAELEIATERVSETSHTARIAQKTSQDLHIRDDDQVLHETEASVFWDREYRTPDIVEHDGSFPRGTSLLLTRMEAIQLRDRYARKRPDGGQSLITHLISILSSSQYADEEYGWPWDIPNQPSDLAHVTEHARLLSAFARGAELQYHAMLFEASTIEDTGTKEAFIAWFDHCSEMLASWDLVDFAALPCVTRARRSDLGFLMSWRSQITGARTARIAYADPEARALLKQREFAMRRTKARLRSAFHLRSWKPRDEYSPTQLYSLSYRHGVATRFASDIAAGLNEGNR